MKLFRVKFKWIMVLICIIAVTGLIARDQWNHWRRKGYRSPASSSRLTAQFATDPVTREPAQPVTISYDFHFDSGAAPEGVEVKLLGSVWLQDTKTREYVDGYTFDVILNGSREQAAETFDWEAHVPRPGHYLLFCEITDISHSDSDKGSFILKEAYGRTFKEASP